MPEISFNPRWRVQLEGDADDLSDLKRVLNGSVKDELSYVVAPWQETVLTLASTRWDKLETAEIVQDAADRALRLFIGALNTYDGCGPVTTGTVYEVLPDGKFLMSRLTHFSLRVKPSLDNRVSPELFAQTVAQTGTTEWMLAALLEMGGDVDWFSVYRAIEAIEERFDRSEAKMIQSTVIDGSKIKLIKQTANSFRHLPGGVHRAPVPPVEFGDALSCVRESIKKIIAAGDV